MNLYVGGAAFCFGLFQLGAIFALRFKRNDIADAIWGIGFPLTALGAIWFASPALGPVEYLILVLVSIWAVRISLYVGLRYWRKGHEDVRYAKWRREWGKTAVWRSYLQVWLLQPAILYLIALCYLSALASGPRNFDFLIWVGVGLWVIGFFFEVVSDAQLKRFQSDPSNKGRVLDRGLWAWSRHPNYFGESLLWWGIWLMCFDSETWWWTVISPITITFLVTYVSGVAMLETFMAGRPGWEEYKSRVPVFFPWFPKSKVR